MDEYILNYQKSSDVQVNIHPDWYDLCKAQTEDAIIDILKKHLYEPGEYTLHVYVSTKPIYHKKNQRFFHGWLTLQTERTQGGTYPVGPIELDYWDDTFDTYDFKTNWPKIDCEQPPTNAGATLTVVSERLFPSFKEHEILNKQAAERFIKRLHNAVTFPLQIACDYPDVIFEVCYSDIPDGDLAAKTLAVFETYANKYNKRHEEKIHFVDLVTTEIEGQKANAVYIAVDFGDCEVSVLPLVLKAVGKSGLPITEMILR
ncbi:MAG: hypothetical protein J6R77_04825 [Clostridia bacterium]|nr:hypothetical protein [Clostridia bacterium]